MARNANIPLDPSVWTQITNADVTALRVQSLSGCTIRLMATAGAVAPTDDEGALTLMPNAILASDLTLADLWPGVAGANRVYAKGAGDVSVSHA